MKYICLNLKRFDVPAQQGGVNALAAPRAWAETIVQSTQEALRAYAGRACFPMYFPEAHLLPALDARCPDSPVMVGCQGVYREDITPGGNFGAYTANRPAAAMRALGVESALIGHCEERADKAGVLAEAGVTDAAAVNRLLNREIRRAVAQGLHVTYCIGEKAQERADWREVLRGQLQTGLEGVNTERVILAYEPIWAIGPGKTPPERDTIRAIAQFIKRESGGLPLLYGGGLKQANAAMLASIAEVDGGLIALTRFAGDIGFYPAEYLDIIRIYMENS